MLLILSIILIGIMTGMKVAISLIVEVQRKKGLYVYCLKGNGRTRNGNSAPFYSKCNLVKNGSWNEFEILKKLCEDTQNFLYSLFAFDSHCK
ncbi:hypothetical protein BK730_30760 [Bacillus wiedmannii]|uniref:Uncharacterized protein n=1 Tax=Bacillus wiedmannii TaxID=1890302 RepID=A0A242YY52_9BACI|nr:hypothetical protein BK730_30760 [Bacillus wiedmannii]OUB38332.1 hypothetical protein BK740_27220 [Bacillus thuringiensis serovar argentinensis]